MQQTRDKHRMLIHVVHREVGTSGNGIGTFKWLVAFFLHFCKSLRNSVTGNKARQACCTNFSSAMSFVAFGSGGTSDGRCTAAPRRGRPSSLMLVGCTKRRYVQGGDATAHSFVTVSTPTACALRRSQVALFRLPFLVSPPSHKKLRRRRQILIPQALR